MCTELCSNPAPCKTGHCGARSEPSTWKEEDQRVKLHGKLEASLGYMEPCLGQGTWRSSNQSRIHPGLLWEGRGKSCIEAYPEAESGPLTGRSELRRLSEAAARPALTSQSTEVPQVATCCWNKALATGGSCHLGRGNTTGVLKH